MKKSHLFIAVVALAAVLSPTGLSRNLETGVSEEASLPEMSPEDLELARDVYRLQVLVEEALVWREKAVAFARAQADRDARGEPISARDLQLMHEGVDQYIIHRGKIMALARKHEWLGENTRRITLNVGRGSRNIARDAKGTILIDPLDVEGRLAIRRLKLSLAAGLTLYDNYLVAVYPFQNSFRLRFLVDYDRKHKGALSQATASYLRNDNMRKIQRGIHFFDLDQKFRAENPAYEEQTRIQYLELLIRGSFNYDRMREMDKFQHSLELTQSMLKQGKDLLRALGAHSVHTMSEVFGNSVGLIQLRKGKLKALPKAERKRIVEMLRPGDILIEKTPFRLTDKFIPGYFGHIAIWLGTESDLRRLGIWDHELVRGHQKAISKGRAVLEALRPGVTLNTFEHFIDVDDLALIRHRTVPHDDAQLREILLRGFLQIGKEYDFNFDVQTDLRIVCSELAYVVYRDETWPTSNSVGRTTISPDHVAVRAGERQPFEILLFYHDGRRIEDAQVEALYSALLRGKQGEIDETRRIIASPRSPGFGPPPQGAEMPDGEDWN